MRPEQHNLSRKRRKLEIVHKRRSLFATRLRPRINPRNILGGRAIVCGLYFLFAFGSIGKRLRKGKR